MGDHGSGRGVPEAECEGGQEGRGHLAVECRWQAGRASIDGQVSNFDTTPTHIASNNAAST